MGQWVICHTVQGNIHGRLLGCNSSHLFLNAPRYTTVSGKANETQELGYAFGQDAVDSANVGYGYGYGYGYGRTAVALASVVGLTAIGLSALWW
jgi:hypothetical protein